MKILAVDDNRETLSFLEGALAEEGFTVRAASDGETGLRLALMEDYDALILDNVLPGKTGLEICAEVRRQGKNSKIILLSVNDEVCTKTRAIEFGADDYLEKPFSFSELLARLRARLRHPSGPKDGPRDRILEAQGFSLDARDRTAFFRKKEARLSPKEFDLLWYLLENRGQTATRMEILEHVWDMNADPLTNTVEMHISNLRKKLRSLGANSLLRTIPRAGYKIS